MDAFAKFESYLNSREFEDDISHILNDMHSNQYNGYLDLNCENHNNDYRPGPHYADMKCTFSSNNTRSDNLHIWFEIGDNIEEFIDVAKLADMLDQRLDEMNIKYDKKWETNRNDDYYHYVLFQ